MGDTIIFAMIMIRHKEKLPIRSLLAQVVI